MGCSPSKGQLFSKRALLSGSQENEKNADQLCVGEPVQIKADINITSEGLAETEIQENAKNMEGKRSSEDDVVCDVTVTVKEDKTDQIIDMVHSHVGQSAQEGTLEKQIEGIEEIQKKEKQIKRRKQRKQRLRKNSYAQSKAEFIMKAHQAACAYLNPSTSKYESLLELLSQAAQSHCSVKTTVASVVLHYEEINQALEEMAAEGEQLLREHGHNMAWPASVQDYPPATAKPSNETNAQFPSELLQEMLLQSTIKMISVGDAVKCLSDTAIQDLADYFGSLSQLFGEKLLAKHAAEERLKQVLSHVEAAALRKQSPDSALHSEDSGIGADNESHNGPEHLRRKRGSSASGANVGITSGFTISCSPDQQNLNGNEEDTDNDDDDEEEEDEDAELEDEVNGKNELMRTMCGSPEADSSHPAVQGYLQNQVKSTNLKRKIRRPKTADNTFQAKTKHCHIRGPKRSQSAECLFIKVEQSDPNEQQDTATNKRASQWRRKNILPDILLGGRVRTKIRKASSGGQCTARNYGLQYGSKGPFRGKPLSSPPSFKPEPPGRNAVKRLISTFSHGAEDSSRQSPIDQRPLVTRGNKKCSLPMLQNRGTLTTNGNMSTTIHPLAEKPEHLDIDSLPPPPPEMLLDNSFESGVGLTTEGAHYSQCRAQRLHSSVLREANKQQGSMSFSTTQLIRQETLLGSCTEEEFKQLREEDSNSENHLPAQTSLANVGLRGSISHQRFENDNEGESATMHLKCLPPTTPPVSRTRLPPSCPTVHHAVPTPPSTACPTSGKWTPTTSSLHRSAKAEGNSLPGSGSRSYSEARAVFCQEKQTHPQTWTPSCTSTLPRPWGEPARGRLAAARLQPSFMGHGSAGQRSQCDAKQQQGQSSDNTPLNNEGTVMSGDTHSALHTHRGSVGDQITD